MIHSTPRISSLHASCMVIKHFFFWKDFIFLTHARKEERIKSHQCRKTGGERKTETGRRKWYESGFFVSVCVAARPILALEMSLASGFVRSFSDGYYSTRKGKVGNVHEDHRTSWACEKLKLLLPSQLGFKRRTLRLPTYMQKLKWGRRIGA